MAWRSHGGIVKSDAVARTTGRTIGSPMEKTTLYLPDDLRTVVKRAAAQQGVSEAEVIRESIRQVVGGVRPGPRGALFAGGQPVA